MEFLGIFSSYIFKKARQSLTLSTTSYTLSLVRLHGYLATLLLLSPLLFPLPTLAANTSSLCNQIPDSSDLKSACTSCASSDDKIWTSFGCISTDTSELVPDFMRLAVSISGATAISLILIAAFVVTTSTSNPERLRLGQEIGTASISGLVFILFSAVLLNFIGVHLIKIPGF